MPKLTVALLGYGRFGAAFTHLLQGAGYQVHVYDPKNQAPNDIARPSAIAAIRDADYVVLAMPVPFIRESIAGILPQLTPAQIVLDVGSVKLHPFEAMQELLGSRIPFVATHPLFGPISLERGDRPRRVVICPSPAHPQAAERVRALFQALDCETIEQDPAGHDRAMARTHAMAFFIAKGLIEFGIDDSMELAPPSFLGVRRMLDAVRGDAGHLFAAIQRQNPFAEEARHDFMQALTRIDNALETSADDDSLTIPQSASDTQHPSTQ